jgi:hypothetical protein
VERFVRWTLWRPWQTPGEKQELEESEKQDEEAKANLCGNSLTSIIMVQGTSIEVFDWTKRSSSTVR